MNIGGESAAAVLAACCFMLGAPTVQLRLSPVNFRCAVVVPLVVTVVWRVSAVVSTRIVSVVASEVSTVMGTN